MINIKVLIRIAKRDIFIDRVQQINRNIRRRREGGDSFIVLSRFIGVLSRFIWFTVPFYWCTVPFYCLFCLSILYNFSISSKKLVCHFICHFVCTLSATSSGTSSGTSQITMIPFQSIFFKCLKIIIFNVSPQSDSWIYAGEKMKEVKRIYI